MSLLSRLFKKPAPAPSPADRPQASQPAQPPAPRPDLQAIARAEETALAEALAAGDRAALGRWVIEGSTTHIRQQAAQAVEDQSQLLELIRAARGKDKHVYRILTAKREDFLARERAARQFEADVAAAAAALEKHAGRAWDANYGDTLTRLAARWDTVASSATESQREAVAAHLQQAREVVASHEREVAAEAERRREAARAADEARRAREHAAQEAATRAAQEAEQIDAERAAEREAVRARREAEDAVVGEIVGLLRQAQAALAHGGTARAARLRDALKAKLPEAPAHALPAWFGRKLEELDARIDELKDWKTFTVVPKRAELVRRMQSLIGADMSPEELARQVRRLREEWRTLHRGAADEPGPEREEFEQLSERAYEPCRAHFAQQAAQRKENQAQRESILERLQAFSDKVSADPTPDWRLIQQVLVEARREWRNFAPVDQEAVKPLLERLHALLDPLQARLDAEYDGNAQARRDLIARAAELASASDTRQAIAEAKELQRAWQAIGLVRRKEADALWEEFRRHCDAVFERNAQQAAAYGASLDAQRVRATAICDELESCATARDAAVDDAAPRVAALRAEFESLELPRASARELRQRFHKALESWEDARRRDRTAAARRGWADAFRVAGLARDYALAAANGVAAEEVEAQRAAALAELENLPHVPKTARAVLARQLAAAPDTAATGDRAGNAATLRALCLRAEMAAGIDSPQEDEQLRRELQMQRLVASMTEGRHDESLEDLALQWLATGPVEADVHEALWRRFERCLAGVGTA